MRACVARRPGSGSARPRCENLSRGRAFFGFANDGTSSQPSPAMTKAEHACERKVGLAQKIDAIVAVDRAPV